MNRLKRSSTASKPAELISNVLKASVYGLLKTCDLGWRELTKGNMNEVNTLTDFNFQADTFV